MIEDLKKFINNDNNIIANKIEKINNIIKRYRGGCFCMVEDLLFVTINNY